MSALPLFPLQTVLLPDGLLALRVFEPRYVDISVPPRTEKRIPIERSHHAFAYVFAGSGSFRDGFGST